MRRCLTTPRGGCPTCGHVKALRHANYDKSRYGLAVFTWKCSQCHFEFEAPEATVRCAEGIHAVRSLPSAPFSPGDGHCIYCGKPVY